MFVVHHPETVAAFLTHLRHDPVVLAYIGPDQIMPLTSVLGAIVGVALMFWNRLVGLAHKCRALLTRRAEEPHKRSAN
jgi:hypothetical protein